MTAAYLLAIIDLRTLIVCEVRIYSERHPTLIGHKMAFEILSIERSSFARAYAELQQMYQHPAFTALRERFPVPK